ncbi:MAG: DNA polymerase III subunit delta [Bacteroidales bacterium]|jgi:DNA polymerase-3 subunit delta'|nr:DNA polymerase III subunit delta [Bacteroidales bacterium]
MQFKDIIGQDTLKKRLLNSVKDNRISHAQLFLGKGSVGKLALAFAYAQYINCTDKQIDDSCGQCSSCRKYAGMSHPDLFFSYPVNTNHTSTSKVTKTRVSKDPVSGDFLIDWKNYIEEVKGYPDLFQWYQQIGIENKQGFISKEEARKIVHQLQYKSVEAEYKVLIVWMVEKMNEVASNALLKLIEEPPDNTLIFLIANEKEKLLSTILSRVQLIVVPPIESEKLQSYLLKQNPNLSENDLRDIASLANGDVFKASEIISNSSEMRENFDLFVEWMRLCYKKGSLEGIKTWSEKTSKFGREKQKSFLNFSLRMVRESLLLNYGNDKLVKIMIHEEQFLSKFAPFIHLKNVPIIQEILNQAIYEIERNVSGISLFADLSLKMSRLLKMDSSGR